MHTTTDRRTMRKPCQLCHAPRDEGPWTELSVSYQGYHVRVCHACKAKLEATRDRRRATPKPRVESRRDAVRYLRRARHGIPSEVGRP